MLRQFVPGQATGTASLQIGGDGAFYDSQLVAALRSHQMFARYDHEIFDGLRAYAQFSGNIKRNETFGDALQFTSVTRQSSNPFLPAATRARLAAAGVTTFTLSKLFGNSTRLDNLARSRQFIYTGGIEGDIGRYKLNLNYTHGDATLRTTLGHNPNYVNIAAALDAVVSPTTGQIVCNAALTNSAYANCVPINVFGPNAESQAAVDYVAPSTHYRAITKQDDFSANIAGSLFDLPAGPVAGAVSGEWRKLSFHSSTDGPVDAAYSCTGLRTNCVATPQPSLYSFSFANSPRISQTVSEGAVELDVPLLKDISFVRALSLNGAARYTHYNTSGNYWTWKVGGVWQITDTLRLRATRSRDIRAPTLYELFAPVNSVPINPLDVKTNTSPRVPSIDLSNPDLTAEKANTITAGVSWNPVRGLSFTVDAYRIKISNAIVQIAGSSAAFQNICYASNGTSFFCTLQQRNAAGTIIAWYTKYLNYANIETKGADFEVNYTTRLADRPLNLRVLAAYQPHAYYRQPGVPTIDQGGVGFGPTGYSAGAKWRVTGFLRFAPTDDLAIDLLEKWRNPVKIGGDESLVIQNNRIKSFATTNMTLTYTVARTSLGQFQFAVNVANLFDRKAPGGAFTGNGTRAGLRDGFVPGDDVVGRAFNFAVRLRR